jgi:hypothetical protein
MWLYLLNMYIDFGAGKCQTGVTVVLDIMVNSILSYLVRHSLLLMSSHGLLLELHSVRCRSDVCVVLKRSQDETTSEFLL